MLRYFTSPLLVIVIFAMVASYARAIAAPEDTVTLQDPQDTVTLQDPQDTVKPQVPQDAVTPQVAGDSVKPQVAKNPIWPTTLYLGADVAKTGRGWYQKTGGAYEISGSIDFSRILLDVDYGWGKIQRDSRPKESFSSTNGRYFKIGLNFNFLTPTFDHNQFFLGLRYARSFFNFNLKGRPFPCNHGAAADDLVKEDPERKECVLCKPPVQDWAHSGIVHSGIAHWWEIVAGTKVRLLSILSIGCTVRYKFGKKIESDLSVEPFDIPGFGLGEGEDAFGYNLYILVRIPLQRKAVPTMTSIVKK